MGGAQSGAECLMIEGDTVEAVSPEGVTNRMPLPEFLDAVIPDMLGTGGFIMPEGIRLIESTASTTVMIWEIPPRVHHVRWISDGSPVPYKMGEAEVEYKERALAMPYLVIMAVFTRDRLGRLTLSGSNEAYFRTAPLKSADDELCFTGLLNVSKFPDMVASTRALAWICTQYTPLRQLAKITDLNDRVRQSLAALKSTMLESGFNYSSEHHELTSYWSLSAPKIKAIADLDRWEALSAENPLFVLDTPWLPAKDKRRRLTVRTLVDRTIGLHGGRSRPQTAAALARVVHNRRPRRGRRAG